jgi:hypothetical protein
MADREVPLIKAKKTSEKDVILDPAGFFVIEVHKEKILVEYYSNVYKGKKIVSGILQKVFEGVRADELCDTIAKHVKGLRNEHYMYLGRELMNAQIAFENHTKYVQGGC